MRLPYPIPSLTVLCSLLILSVIACGEIELPQPDTPGGTEQSGNTDKPDQTETPDKPDTPDEPDSPDNPDSPDTPNTPDVPDIAEGLVFGTVTITPDRHILINDSFYLSTEEVPNVLSAYSTTPTAAAELAAEYQEGDLDDWHIPTYDEARALRGALACISPFYAEEETDILPKLNKALDGLGLRGIYREWYLCDEGKQVFDFDFNNSIKKASKTTKYRLRLAREKRASSTSE